MLKAIGIVLLALILVGAGVQFAGIYDFTKLITPYVGQSVTYLGISFGVGLTTGSPSVSALAPYISTEYYRTKILTITPTQEVYRSRWLNSTKDYIGEKLSQYGVIVHITKNIKIYNNETDALLYDKSFDFVSGLGRKLEIWFNEATIPVGTSLRIEISWYISIEISSAGYTWQKSFTKIIYTTKTSETANEDRPTLSFEGTLIDKAHPGLLTVQVIALEANLVAVEQLNIIRQWSSTQPFVIYLSLNGQLVTTANQLGEFTVGDFVSIGGQLSRASTYWQFEVTGIEKA